MRCADIPTSSRGPSIPSVGQPARPSAKYPLSEDQPSVLVHALPGGLVVVCWLPSLSDPLARLLGLSRPLVALSPPQHPTLSCSNISKAFTLRAVSLFLSLASTLPPLARVEVEGLLRDVLTRVLLSLPLCPLRPPQTLNPSRPPCTQPPLPQYSPIAPCLRQFPRP